MRLVYRRSQVPGGCEKCDAWEENPEQYVQEVICPECPWSQELTDVRLHKFLDYLSLIEAGCPVARHELTNEEWMLLGTIKMEKEKIIAENMKKERESKKEE